MGGMTALAYLGRPASKRPVEPESVVLVATAAGKLGSHGLGRLLSTPATSILYHLVHRMPRAGTDQVVQFLARPVCAALTRHGGYGDAAPKPLVAMSAAAINATPSTTKIGFLRALKDYDCSQTLSSITANTTIVSGGADKLTPIWHAHELADGLFLLVSGRGLFGGGQMWWAVVVGVADGVVPQCKPCLCPGPVAG